MSNYLNKLIEKARNEEKAIKLTMINGRDFVIEPSDEISVSNGEIFINEEALIALSYVSLVKLIPPEDERLKQFKEELKLVL